MLRVIGAWLLIGTLLGCEGRESEDNTDKNVVISEPAGSASYFLDNQTQDELSVTLQTSPGLGSQLLTEVIAPGEVALLLEDAMFGVNPRPSDSIASITVEGDSGSLVQDPVDEDAWVTPSPPSWGEYVHTEWTLHVTDADLL